MKEKPISSLCTPALVVDVDKVKRNALRMIERCGSRRCIVVSTLAEACFYADHGFDDILYAYSLPLDKVERCADLSERLDLFQILLDHPHALDELKKRPLRDGRLWHVWLKLDCGNGRAGVLHSQPEAISLAQAIVGTKGVELTGVYVHCGNSYNCRGVEQIQAVAQETTDLTLQFMEKYGITNMVKCN
ncbi:hypothetical protein JOQ06_024439 [Pogonophryne albipinna]|uniref:Alanine racemase N-terminal domain-containing protein n=1 Tax=Pogonophryne albipinna TaxID=1090488 RepID=A0AAD6A6V8_9TELE|nr:hypothetical protein JOQ06_024439 [Pogonophryne albipinna]